MKRFEVGKRYIPNDIDYEPITVLRRTKKTVFVGNSTNAWVMRVKKDAQGDEYVTDSSVPARWRHAFTYSAKNEIR